MPFARPRVRPTILSVGPDASLLIARTHVLKSAGYNVIAAIDRHVAVLAAANHELDLALLCHAFDEDECESIGYDLQIVSPRLTVLWLGYLVRSAPLAPQISPERLLHAVGSALAIHSR